MRGVAEFGGEEVFSAGQSLGGIVDGGEEDSVAAGVVEEGVTGELARGVSRGARRAAMVALAASA